MKHVKKVLDTRILENSTSEILEFFREWDKENDEYAKTFLESILETIETKFTKIDKARLKAIEEKKKAEERLSDANFDIEQPLHELSLRTIHAKTPYILRQNPNDRTCMQHYRIDIEGYAQWHTIEFFKTERECKDVLLERELEGAIFLRCPKNQY